MSDPPVTTTATVIEARGPSVFLAALPNGKRVPAHLPKALSHLAPLLAPGSRVVVELTPFDFEKARIAAIVEPA